MIIFALVQAAIVSGATTYAAIRRWIGVAPQQVPAGVGARRDPRTGRLDALHPDMVCRTLAQVDPAQVDAAHARFWAAQVPDLRNMVISSDVKHTQCEHARYLHTRDAQFVLPVGGNQRGLFDQLDPLDWKTVRSAGSPTTAATAARRTAPSRSAPPP